MQKAGSGSLTLVNGLVVTMDARRPRAAAVAVRDGRIVAVGDRAEIDRLDPKPREVVDLHGATVLPGFIDSHVHAFSTGMALCSADLAGARDVQDVCGRLREHAAHLSGGRWVYGFGCAPWTLAERRFPTAPELDAAVGDRPVYVTSTSFHSGATNTAGLRELAAAGLPFGRSPGEPEAGWFVDDESHFAAARLAFGSLSDAEIVERYRRVAERAVSKGVTTLHCLEGQFITGDRDVQVLHERADELPLHVLLMYQTMDVDRVLAMGLDRIGGCLTVDGACFEHTACFYEPYLDKPDTCGELNYSEEEIHAFVDRAHRAGLQVGMHAIGDRAIDVLVRAYDAAARAFPRDDCRHRVEHFQLPTEWAIERALALRLALPMQPAFSYLWDNGGDGDYDHSFGPERAERMEPFRRLAELGAVVSGGSDSPVTSIDPLFGVHAAANNPRASRRTDVDTALRMFTTNGAWVGREEHERGAIIEGMRGDLVVIDCDPYAEREGIGDARVELTVSDGAVTYASGEL